MEPCLSAVAPDLIVNAAGGALGRPQLGAPGRGAARSTPTAFATCSQAAARTAPDAHLVCLSSAAVYGQPGEGEMPLARGRAAGSPVSPYGEAKLAMEAFCREAEGRSGLRVAVVRAFNLIGPGQPPFNAASSLARQIAEAELAGAGGRRAGARQSRRPPAT